MMYSPRLRNEPWDYSGVKATALSVDSDTWAKMLAMVLAFQKRAIKAGYVAVESLIEEIKS